MNVGLRRKFSFIFEIIYLSSYQSNFSKNFSLVGSYSLEPKTFVRWKKCPQHKKDCKLDDDYSACLTFGKELCNGIKDCIGFSINKNPNKNPNDIIYYTGIDLTCIEANKELETRFWDLYLRTGQGNWRTRNFYWLKINRF